MKTNKFITSILITIFSISFVSCVEDGDFTVPKDLGTEENTSLNNILDSVSAGNLELKTIEQVKLLFKSGGYPQEILSNIVVKGYVVSSDKTGNFFKEFYMQDTPENPTSGIKIILNLTDNHNKYNVGREVYIRLKGLFIGEANARDGVTAIGGKIKSTDTREIESLSTNQISNHLYRSTKIETIIPKLVSLGNLKQSDIGTFVTIENVFFPLDLVGRPYVNPNDFFDTKLKIESCEGQNIFNSLLETSSFASFKNETIPGGGGYINAIVSKDFGGDFTVLVLNNTDDVHMNEERCSQ